MFRSTALAHLLWGLAVFQIAGSTARVFCQCTFSDPVYSRLVQRGQKAKDAAQWDKAVKSFQEALQLQPGCAMIKTQLGGLFYNKREYTKALTYFEGAFATNSHDFYAAKFGGISAYWLDHYDEAIRLLDRARAIRRNDARVYYWLGECYYAEGHRRRALDDLQTAAHYSPRDVEILYLLGKIYWELSQQAWEEMEKINPASYRVEQMIAEKYSLDALYPEAIKEYLIIIKQKPNMPGFHEALGRLYLQLRDPSRAENEFREELQLNPYSYTSYCELADALFQEQNLPAAIANVKKALAGRADYGEAYVILGKIYSELGRKREAVSALEQATRLLPAAPSPYYMLAHLYAQSRQPQLAARARNKYEELIGERRLTRPQVVQEVRRTIPQSPH